MEKIRKIIRIIIMFVILISSFSFIETSILFESKRNQEAEYKFKNKGKNFNDFLMISGENAEFEWYKEYRDQWSKWGKDLALDSEDNIYVVGYGRSTYGGEDIMLIKYNSSGIIQWVRIWGTSYDDVGYAIAISSTDDIIIGGYSEVTGNDEKMRFLKYNVTGDLQWAKIWSIGSSDKCYSIELDDSDNIYLGGKSDSKMCFVKFDNDGIYQWHRLWNYFNNDDEYVYGIAIDLNNNIYLTGKVGGFTTDSDIFLIKYDSLGTLRWFRVIGGGATDDSYDIALDNTNPTSPTIYIVGSCGNVASAGDLWLLKYTHDGGLLWDRKWTQNGYQCGYGVIVDPHRNIYITGETSINNNLFLVIYNRIGDLLEVNTWGIGHKEVATSITLDSKNNVYMSGELYNPIEYYSSSLLIKYKNPGPDIKINLPEEYKLFGNLSPFYDITIKEDHLNTIWYIINNRSKYYINETTGRINQTMWNALEDGLINIRFYGNDSFGVISYREVYIYKDTKNPMIYILNPDHQQIFGNNPPYFNIDINEPNLNTTWYSLNNGLNYTFFNTSGFIDQESWDACENGTVIIRFYANDTLGHIGSTEVMVRKEIIAPIWNLVPQDKILEFGDDLYYDLDAYDLSGIDYWWINETTIFNITENGVITNIIPLTVGLYWLEIRSYDPYGNYCNASIKIIVQDTTAPIWDTIPTDQSIEFGNDLYYDVDAYDLSGIDYWWINDTSIFNINTNGIITNIIPLSAAQYWLEIRAYDPYGNYCSASIKIVVIIKNSSPGISGYNVFLLIGAISVILIILIKKKKYY